MTRQEALSLCVKRYKVFTMNNRTITLCAIQNGGLTSYTYVGMSICNPNDTSNPKLGRNIAYARANYYEENGKRKHTFRRYGDTMLTGMVDAYLKECEMKIRENPSEYIKSLS